MMETLQSLLIVINPFSFDARTPQRLSENLGKLQSETTMTTDLIELDDVNALGDFLRTHPLITRFGLHNKILNRMCQELEHHLVETLSRCCPYLEQLELSIERFD